MKIYMAIVLALLLGGCATSAPQKTKSDIVKEALVIQGESNWLKPVKAEPELTIIQVPSHGWVGASLAAALGGAADTRVLREALMRVQNNTTEGLLFITDSFIQDRAIISNAVEDLHLDGVNFFLAASEDEGKALEPVIRASGANFIFIDKYK